MKNKINYKIAIMMPVFLPVFASAQSYLGQTSNIINTFANLIQIIIPIVFALAVLFFFWGVAKYIFSVGTGKEEGKQIMVWGVIALFVMSSIWGLVAFLGRELNVAPGTNAPKIPTLNIP